MITNEELLAEIKSMRQEVDNISKMIYETNSDFYDTWQITCFDNDHNFHPLTNRELLLYMMDRFPAEDTTTWREKLMTREEAAKMYRCKPEEAKHSFEIQQGEYDGDI